MAKRYIDADALIKSAESKRLVIDTAKTTVAEALRIQGKAIREAIENAPTADVAEVVRCSECEYGKKATINDKGFKICPASGMEITDNDYCSYGERRTDDGNL